MAGPSDSNQLADITYESGVDANGEVASPSFATWNGQAAAAYDPTTSSVAKWHNDSSGHAADLPTTTAGTASGTITYSFASGLTTAQKTAFTNTLDLWSDESGLTFTLSTSGPADVVFRTSTSGGTYNTSASHYTSYSGKTLDGVGQQNIASFITPDVSAGSQDVINFDTSGGYGQIGDFSTTGGYGVSSLTHEIGHMIGLGHSGAYNDGSGINPSTHQYNAFDSRQYSVMSYIDPSDASATYYNSYAVKGTKWTSTQGNTIYQVAPETPMMDDILAAQRLYGASSRSTLSGGQVFGFNCNITDGAKSFFDFSVNVNPVVTLFDTGTNNTLDCSGFSTNCTINLNPGTFSTASAGTLTNNIGIAYDTRIDKAIGGSGDDSFTVNTNSDTIDGGGGLNKAVFSGNRSNYVIAATGPTTTVTNTSTGAIDTLSNIQTLQFADQSVTLCFVSGTRIATARGEIAVEHLVVGDLALTASGDARPIRWIGHRTIACAEHARPHDVMPVRIAAQAFGAGLPARDLQLSPGHPVLVGAGEDGDGGVLVPIMCLVNGTTVRRVRVEAVTYWHVELDAHDILLAEGLPAESYLDWGERAFFTEAADHALANPDFVVPGLSGRCRPVAIDGPIVEAQRSRLDMAFVSRLAADCAWPEEEGRAGVVARGRAQETNLPTAMAGLVPATHVATSRP